MEIGCENRTSSGWFRVSTSAALAYQYLLEHNIPIDVNIGKQASLFQSLNIHILRFINN
ncbi:MAG: hypothetical protein HOF98_04925 [Gammaproteobacteria bacterium]|nr:hypothetical protein [Gammaproteobacteria bacterium]